MDPTVLLVRIYEQLARLQMKKNNIIPRLKTGNIVITVNSTNY